MRSIPLMSIQPSRSVSDSSTKPVRLARGIVHRLVPLCNSREQAPHCLIRDFAIHFPAPYIPAVSRAVAGSKINWQENKGQEDAGGGQ